jgi:hypothetical protein
MTPLEKVLEAEFEDLLTKIAELEAELANRPVVWAIQHIETKELSDRGESVDLYYSKEAAESAIRSDFFEPSELQAVIYTGEQE